MSAPSLRSAIDAKCRDCGGSDGGARYWRVHVSVCPVTECPLWPVRPLARRNVPCWLASRNAADLPVDFLSLTTEAAIAFIRGADAVMDAKTVTNSSSDTVQASEHGEGA